MSKSVASHIISRIRGHGRGWVFTPTHFRDIASEDAIDATLRRLKEKGVVRCLSRGLYDYPKKHPEFDMLSPSVEDIARAFINRSSERLQPAGAYAANIIGLSEQVPVTIVFLTDGPTRRLNVGGMRIELKHTTPRNMANAGRKSGMVIQACRFIGQAHLSQNAVQKIMDYVQDVPPSTLLLELRYAPAWVLEALRPEIVKKQRV